MPADALAIAVALAQPWASCVLSGAVTPEQVVSNVSGADLDVPPGACDELVALAEDPREYWAARSRRPWS